MKPEHVEYRLEGDDDDLDAVAMVGGEQVGYANGIKTGDSLFLADIHIELPFQCQKIGSGLLRFVLNVADAACMREVWGKVTADDLDVNPHLLEWYQRHGFEIIEPDSDMATGPVALKKVVRRR